MDPVSGFTLKVLNGKEDYATWKFRMKAYLIDCSLWEAVNGYPEGDKTDEITKIRKDERALAKICLTLGQSAIPHIHNCDKAKEAWDKLKGAYEDSGMGSKLHLQRKLYRFNLKEFKNIEEYLTAIMSTAQKLSDIGKVIPDEDLAAIILGGLTERYDPMILALESSDVKITTEIIKNKLINDMGRDNQISNEKVFASNTFNKKSERFKKKEIICYNCQRKGHKRPDCPLLKKHNKKGETSLYTNTCKEISDLWYVDSGATAHMTSNKSLFKNFTATDNLEITVANNQKIFSSGIGDIPVSKSNSEIKSISDVLYVPEVNANILSVSKCISKGFKVLFNKDGAHIMSNETKVTGNVILKAPLHNGLYKFSVNDSEKAYNAYNINKQRLWHKRLGHLCRYGMNLLSNGMADGLDFKPGEDKDVCTACHAGKQSRQPFKNIPYKAARNKLELIHSDLCGPFSVESFEGNKYMLLFIDDFSRMIFAYFIKSKDEVFDKFIEFKAFVEKQTDRKIKILRSDNGTEYVNYKFQNFLKCEGIQHQTSIPRTPEQNGLAERTNRSIIEKARSMLHGAELSQAFWEDAVRTAVYIKNRSPHRSLYKSTPQEKWTGVRPNLSHLRVFGCRALLHVPKEERKKWDSKTKEYIFVGYSENKKSYKFRDITYPRKIVHGRDVIFKEENFSSNNEDSNKNDHSSMEKVSGDFNISTGFEKLYDDNATHNEDVVDSQDSFTKENDESEEDCVSGEEVDVSDEEIDPNISTSLDTNLNGAEFRRDDQSTSSQQHRYPKRERKNKEYNDYVLYKVESKLSSEPLTVEEALSRDDRDNWVEAMQEEYKCLMKNDTWELVKRNDGQKIIPCKWVFKLKRDSKGDILKYKARLVAKGFTQTHGIDYNETFSPVVRDSTIRLLIAIAANCNMSIDHLDVETAFLNGTLDEKIFMEQPEYFKTGNNVCLLKKSIYGLKQASRVWSITMKNFFSKEKYVQSKHEPCLFSKRIKDKVIYVTVYVDDILIFSNSNELKER
jgi:transposase InsO family protein